MKSNLHLKPALLIGGTSSRMGENKAVLAKNGESLGSWLANLLEKVTGEKPVLLGAGDIGPNTSQYTLLPDPEKNRGPLAGLMAFVEAHANRDLLILPTDLFAMNEAALRWMIDCARKSSSSVLWPRQPQRRHGEPLAAIYTAASFPLLITAWKAGKGSPCQAVPAEHRVEPIIPDEHRLAFVNINTPEELDAVKNGLVQPLNSLETELLFPTSKKRAH